MTDNFSGQIYAALFPHIAMLWEQIRDNFADQEFTYNDLRSIGIWPEEASTALRYLCEQWQRIEVVGLRTFKIRSIEPIDEYCPPGVRLGGLSAAGVIIVAFKVYEHNKGKLEEVGRQFVKAVIPLFGSLLVNKQEGGPVKLTIFPNSDVVQVTFNTKSAPLSEIAGFECWAKLKSLEFGVLT